LAIFLWIGSEQVRVLAEDKLIIGVLPSVTGVVTELPIHNSLAVRAPVIVSLGQPPTNGAARREDVLAFGNRVSAFLVRVQFVKESIR
jgi:hypothetical protein